MNRSALFDSKIDATPSAVPPPAAAGCYLDGHTSDRGGNLYGRHLVNHTESLAACCSLCQATTRCVIFQFDAKGCYGSKKGCCRLKTAEAWSGRTPRPNQQDTFGGSVRPLPPPPPPPSPPAYACHGTQCVLNRTAGGPYNNSVCDHRCMGPGRRVTSLAPLAFERLPVGAIAPAGWLRDQLTLQLHGLSGHLQRFWPDVANSTWIYPEVLTRTGAGSPT